MKPTPIPAPEEGLAAARAIARRSLAAPRAQEGALVVTADGERHPGIALHLPAPAHHHGAPDVAAPTTSTLMAVATLLAFIEIVAAAAALYVGSRGRMVTLSDTRDR